MTSANVKLLLEKLRAELRNSTVDDETREALQAFDGEIHQLIGEEDSAGEPGAVVERARELESRFATDHPTAARVMREILDTLGKLGI
jgi:hypothetical protein